ncbi:MAG: acyl-ACP--UDP-N-acetylglucosamine O-acyltransferase [Armatimonadetes bacterium]|nr:acyl-ACP--UDP-N-acetylglucosamine O-acyltransferase [Armatimonadota bacterium]
MTEVHPQAAVDCKAQLGDDVRVGPFAVIDSGVEIGAGTVIETHAVIRSGVTIGERNLIGEGCVIGGDPQDQKYAGAPTYLRIGNDNVFREFVTIHRAKDEGKATIVGDGNFLMAFSHLGHNVTVHNHVTMANGVGVSGHVTVEDGANIGGMTGVHQYVRIGKYAMVGGMSRVVQDVPPFMLTEGKPLRIYDINAVGLRRLGVPAKVRLALHKACKLLFRSEMGLTKAIEVVRREVQVTEEVEYLLNFLENIGSGRYGRQDQK